MKTTGSYTDYVFICKEWHLLGFCGCGALFPYAELATISRAENVDRHFTIIDLGLIGGRCGRVRRFVPWIRGREIYYKARVAIFELAVPAKERV